MSGSEKPEVQHVYQHHHLDSTRWRYFEHRPGDIIISTSYKAGTTWMQTIVGNLLYPNGDCPLPVQEMSPWVDMRIFPLEGVLNQLAAQDGRRFVKTHLPLDALPYYEDVQYVMVGRDPRDVFMSLLNHWGKHTPGFISILNSTPGRVGEPFPPYSGDIRATWRDWMTKGWFDWESEGYPYWGHMHHCASWWQFRHLPNIKLVHYSDLLQDLDGQMRDLAAYLEIEVADELWPQVVDACTFATVKRNPEKITGTRASKVWQGGAQTFINKGTNGRWKDVLTDEDLALYETTKTRVMPTDCSDWLEHGWLAD